MRYYAVGQKPIDRFEADIRLALENVKNFYEPKIEEYTHAYRIHSLALYFLEFIDHWVVEYPVAVPILPPLLNSTSVFKQNNVTLGNSQSSTAVTSSSIVSSTITATTGTMMSTVIMTTSES